MDAVGKWSRQKFQPWNATITSDEQRYLQHKYRLLHAEKFFSSICCRIPLANRIFQHLLPWKPINCAMFSVCFFADIADKQKFQGPFLTLNTIGSVWMAVGHAMTQAMLWRSLNEDARVRSHVIPSGISVGQRGQWEKFVSKYFGFPLSVWFHQRSALIHLSPTLYKLKIS